MDTNMEEKIYHQIEKSLSNNFQDNLFSTGQFFDPGIQSGRSSKGIGDTSVSADSNIRENLQAEKDELQEYIKPLPQLSRAEYIRQAREACMRQMNSIQPLSRRAEDFIMNQEAPDIDYEHKQSRRLNLFHSDTQEKDTAEEIASFRSLMIRSICAIIIFISIFVIDKFEIKWGDFTYETIREYVMGNDKMQELETWIVSWLK